MGERRPSCLFWVARLSAAPLPPLFFLLSLLPLALTVSRMGLRPCVCSSKAAMAGSRVSCGTRLIIDASWSESRRSISVCVCTVCVHTHSVWRMKLNIMIFFVAALLIMTCCATFSRCHLVFFPFCSLLSPIVLNFITCQSFLFHPYYRPERCPIVECTVAGSIIWLL